MAAPPSWYTRARSAAPRRARAFRQWRSHLISREPQRLPRALRSAAGTPERHTRRAILIGASGQDVSSAAFCANSAKAPSRRLGAPPWHALSTRNARPDLTPLDLRPASSIAPSRDEVGAADDHARFCRGARAQVDSSLRVCRRTRRRWYACDARDAEVFRRDDPFAMRSPSSSSPCRSRGLTSSRPSPRTSKRRVPTPKRSA